MTIHLVSCCSYLKLFICLVSGRIYTVSVDSGDKMLLANSITSFVTSLSVFVAAFYYKGPAAKAKSRLQ